MHEKNVCANKYSCLHPKLINGWKCHSSGYLWVGMETDWEGVRGTLSEVVEISCLERHRVIMVIRVYAIVRIQPKAPPAISALNWREIVQAHLSPGALLLVPLCSWPLLLKRLVASLILTPSYRAGQGSCTRPSPAGQDPPQGLPKLGWRGVKTYIFLLKVTIL